MIHDAGYRMHDAGPGYNTKCGEKDKSKIRSTKSETNPKFKLQMFKTATGPRRKNYEEHKE
jgi:hypothetical protein